MFSPEQNELYRELSTSFWWDARTVTVAAGALYACVLVGIAFTQDFANFLTFAFLTGIPLLLGLLIAFFVLLRKYDKKIQGNAAVLLPEADNRFQNAVIKAKNAQDAALKKSERMQIILIVVLFLIPGGLIAALFLCLYLRKRIKRQYPIPEIPGKALHNQFDAHARKITARFALIPACCAVLMVGLSMVRFTAQSRLNAYNNAAKQVYQAAGQFLQDTDQNFPDGIAAFCAGDEPEPGSLYEGICEYCTGLNSREYYAVVIEGNQPLYVVCGDSSVSDAIQLSKAEQDKTLLSDWIHDTIIGCYPQRTQEGLS